MPAIVWVLVLVHLALLTLYAVLVPTWRAPDEPQHADMVFAVRDWETWPTSRDRRMSGQIVESMDAAGFDFETRLTASPLEARDAIARSARPTFDEIAPDTNTGSTNYQFQHPPLYYVMVASAVTAMTAFIPGGGAWSHDQMVVAMRLVSVVLVAPLPLFSFLAGRRLGLRRSVAVAAAAFPLAVPQLTHIGSTINNDSLLVAAVGAVTVLLARVATGDARIRTGAWVGLWSGVALLTKGLALFLPLMIAAAYALAARTVGVHRAVRPAIVSGVTAVAMGGWWWIANVFRYGTVQPKGIEFEAAPESFTPDVVAWIGTAATVLPQRWWGSFGWYQVSLPWAVVWTATAVVMVGVVAALVVGPERATAGHSTLPGGHRASPIVDRYHVGLMLIPLAGILAIVVYGAYSYYVASGRAAALQGRYLFPGITGLGVVAAAGWSALLRGRDRLLPLAVLLATAVLQVVSLVLILLRFYGVADGSTFGGAIAAFLAWAPWDPEATTVLVLLVIATGAAAALLMIGTPADADGGDCPEPPEVVSSSSKANRVYD